MQTFSAEDVKTINDLSTGRAQSAPPPVVELPTPDVQSPAVPTQTPPAATPDPNKPPAAIPAVTTPPAEPDYLSKLGFKTQDELQDRLTKYSELEKKTAEYEQQLNQLNEYKAGPKFASERHKLLYDYGSKVEGMELQSARQLLEVVSLDLKTLPDQQIRFEAFKLMPENQNLSQDEVISLFKATEVERFGNPQDTENPQTEIQKIRAKQATAQAKDSVSKLQAQWNAAKTATPDPEGAARQKLEYQQMVNQRISSFDGIPTIKLLATDEKGEKLEGAINFKIDKEKQMPAVSAALHDLPGWWDKKLQEYGVTNGENFDVTKLAELVSKIEYHDQLMNMAYQQGQSDGVASKLKTARNVSDPSDVVTPVVTPVKITSEKQDAAQAARKAAGF